MSDDRRKNSNELILSDGEYAYTQDTASGLIYHRAIVVGTSNARTETVSWKSSLFLALPSLSATDLDDAGRRA